MINCEKASELTSKKIDLKLSVWENISLKFHTMMCSACTLFEEEANTLTNAINRDYDEHKCSKRMTKVGKDKLQNLLKS